MKENFIKLSHNLIFLLIFVAAAAAVLFFLPTSSEFFEFNKLSAILAITVLCLLIWAVRMILEKRAVFARTPLDIPILIFIAVFFVATFSSIDQFTSLVGAHGRFWPGLLALATVVAFYFMVVSNLKSKKHVATVLWVVVAATAVASLVAIASYFGIFAPFEFAKIRSFNPLGVINRLALLEALVIPIAATWAVFGRHKVERTTATIATLVLAFSFILINSGAAYIGLAAALGFVAVGGLRIKLDKAGQGTIVLLAVFIFLFLVIRFVPQVSTGTLYAWIAAKDAGVTERQQIDTPKERVLPARAAWDIAASTIGKRPLLGTGPGTYQFAYTQLKPRYVNATPDWAIRFDKSSSDFSELVATTGILGILAYLILIVAAVRFLSNLVFKSAHFASYLPLAAAIFGYLVAGFFTVSSIPTTFVFFVVLALLSVLARANDEPQVYEVTVEIAALKSKLAWLPFGVSAQPVERPQGAAGRSQILPAIFTLCVLVLSAIALNYQVAAYRAEYFYRQSILAARANDGTRTINFLQKAIAANPRIDTYHRELSQTALNAALNLSQSSNLSDNDRQVLTQLAQVAIDQGKVASGYQILPLRLPGISAPNVANWETLASVYQTLIGAVGGADVHATNTLAQAVALDPENPILHYQLGQLYQRLNNLDLAQRKYEDAIVVKSDWGPAHYSLAKLLIERKGEVPRIVNELTLAKRFLPAEDPALPDIESNLETYNKQLREIQEKAQQTPAGGPSPSPGTSPSPSPSPSPTGEPSPSPSAEPTPSPSL